MKNTLSVDLRLLKFLQRNFADVLSPSILHCHKFMRPTDDSRVYVNANSNHAHFSGLTECGNVWVCPVCEAKRMNKVASDVACAIEALRRDYAAIMVTFTVPHIKPMSCNEVYGLLMTTWHKFTKYRGRNNAFSIFNREGGVKHYVRVVEVTHGVNGWHPHIHALYWVRRSALSTIGQYEEPLLRQWQKAFVLSAKQVTPRFADYVADSVVTGNATCDDGLTFSRDSDGNVREQLSSMYVAGWQADRELTGNAHRKASSNGHRTIYQILTDAYNTGGTADKRLLREFITSMFWKRRVRKSPGLNAIIAKYKLTNSYIKFTEEKKSTLQTRTIMYFDAEQWSQICFNDFYSDINIKAKILELAVMPNGRRRIVAFLLDFDINVEGNAVILDRLERAG